MPSTVFDASPWIVPAWHAPPRVRAVTTTRSAGNLASHTGDDPNAVEGRREKLRLQHGLRAITWLDQVHGTEVVAVTERSSREPHVADAAWTELAGLACAVLTADCVPVLLSDLDGRVVGAAHGGWRGLVGGVVEALVDALPVTAERLVAWLGPAIGQARYEVGPEVAAAIESSVGVRLAARVLSPSAGGPDKWLADLVTLARVQLDGLGVATIDSADACTYDDARFYSYRRDKSSGRMASLIWLDG
jgi:YfiH family protein